MTLPTYLVLALALPPLAVFLIVYQFLAVRPLTPPSVGPIGARRLKTRAQVEIFRKIEPALLLIGAWFAMLPLGERRDQLKELLHSAGDWWGLRPEEFLALSFLVGVATTAFAYLTLSSVEQGMGIAPILGFIGFIYPYVRLKSIVDDRNIALMHGLPNAIDVMALAMGAGLDFPGAIREVTTKASDPNDPLVEEFARILQDLRLGHTRKRALEAFAERAPLEPIEDFVGTVVQAEERGNPLAKVLSIQAEVLRNKRSVRAEESAAKAAAALIGPLVFVMVLAFIIMVGPVAIQLSQQEF